MTGKPIEEVLAQPRESVYPRKRLAKLGLFLVPAPPTHGEGVKNRAVGAVYHRRSFGINAFGAHRAPPQVADPIFSHLRRLGALGRALGATTGGQ